MLSICIFSVPLKAALEIPQYQVYELVFTGSTVSPGDSPVRDVILETMWRHVAGGLSYHVYGFWDGDGRGGPVGPVYKVRFCPTLPGEWELTSVVSNDPGLDGQHEGFTLHCIASGHHGFWERDPESAGGRWYKRSDGSHPYIIGNTMYSYLSEHYLGGSNGSDINSDTRHCAAYYNKLRFAITGDIYPHPTEKPFLDNDGLPTDDGNYSHRPNPAWFSHRVDLAVRTAYEADMIADLIINSVDSKQGRSVLKAGANGGDAVPILRYMSARYGSFPNVWFCLSNEYNIRDPRFMAAEIRDLGIQLRDLLAYPTPISVHPNQRDWDPDLQSGKEWNDHIIFQNKIKYIWMAADKVDLNHYKGAGKPVIDDELAYQGEGDGWLQEDVLEAFLGAFLGGGYGSTGYKTGHKLGQYFAGHFDATQHSTSDNLLWFRQQIDAGIEFWNMQPSTVFYTNKDGIRLDIFRHVDYDFRLLKEDGKAYVLGAAGPRKNILAQLPEGNWDIVLYDLVAMSTRDLGSGISGEFAFDLPGTRALFVVLKRPGL